MRVSRIVVPLSLSSRLLRSRGRVNWRIAATILVVSGAQIAAVLIAAWLDNSWFLGPADQLQKGGKGLLEHYGAWAILVTDPLLLIASGFLDRQFCVAMLSLPLRSDRDAAQEVSRAVRTQVPWVRGGGYSAFLYALFVVIGIYAWA